MTIPGRIIAIFSVMIVFTIAARTVVADPINMQISLMLTLIKAAATVNRYARGARVVIRPGTAIKIGMGTTESDWTGTPAIRLPIFGMAIKIIMISQVGPTVGNGILTAVGSAKLKHLWLKQMRLAEES